MLCHQKVNPSSKVIIVPTSPGHLSTLFAMRLTEMWRLFQKWGEKKLFITRLRTAKTFDHDFCTTVAVRHDKICCWLTWGSWSQLISSPSWLMNHTRSDTCSLSLPISALCNTWFHGTSMNLLFYTHHSPHVLPSHSFSHHSFPRVPFLLVLPVVFWSFLQYPSLLPSRQGDFFSLFFKKISSVCHFSPREPFSPWLSPPCSVFIDICLYYSPFLHLFSRRHFFFFSLRGRLISFALSRSFSGFCCQC